MVTRGGVDWGVEGVTCVVKEVVTLAGTKSGEDWDKKKGAVSVEEAGVVALAEAVHYIINPVGMSCTLHY